MSFRTRIPAWVLCGCVCLTVLRTAAGEPPPAADLAAEVKQAIADLDANRLSVRRAAEERLMKLGPAVLPHLPPPELIRQPGVRQILKRLRIQLEKRQARLSAAASLVTLQGKFPLNKILRGISDQTGNQFDASALPMPLLEGKVEIDFQKTPFWKVVDHLCKELGLRHRLENRMEALQLLLADGKVSPEIAVTYSGPFRVAVPSTELRRPEYDQVRVGVALTAEPRMRSLILSYAAKNWTLQLPDGLLLPPVSPGAFLEFTPEDGGRRVQLSIDFIDTDKPIDKIALDGKFTVTTVVGDQRIRFSDLERSDGVARRRGGISVILNKATTTENSDGTYDARIDAAVVYDAQGPAFESHRTWINHNHVYLETPEGKRIDFAGNQRTTDSDTGAVLMEYPFPNLKQPLSEYEFVYVAPTLIVEIPATIHFADLPVKN
ncbi:hypothetical protein CA54_29980 [Symmachiella macrocystis]|uniref:Uncharacterized protein n=1 Tax=Symmachiella macrocystis TaxID=2527985 RepID=A0A5C6BQ55_9PLAN|nr:hypothetical protein [Symmachiella macrocystis]TWU14155.1 hypothetical protein CA54_29980 [Symmachiella macrocystis]